MPSLWKTLATAKEKLQGLDKLLDKLQMVRSEATFFKKTVALREKENMKKEIKKEKGENIYIYECVYKYKLRTPAPVQLAHLIKHLSLSVFPVLFSSF